MKMCSYELCQRPVKSSNYCEKHYSRNRRHGDPGMASTHYIDCDCCLCLDKPIDTKRCGGCKQFKPLSTFHKTSATVNGLQNYCAECASLATIKSKYGLSQEQYYCLLESQKGMCAICPTTQAGRGGRWFIDHDHTCCPGRKTCGKCVRGLLCNKCNLLLGNAQDDIAVLRSAIRYLKDRRADSLRSI